MSLKTMLIYFFKIGQVQLYWLPNSQVFSKLKTYAIEEIERLISSEEIKMAIFSMSPFKALRQDGLHVLLFLEPIGAYRKISL